ncbi:hypothetical protein V5799_029629 [Amblyomma americanum]
MKRHGYKDELIEQGRPMEASKAEQELVRTSTPDARHAHISLLAALLESVLGTRVPLLHGSRRGDVAAEKGLFWCALAWIFGANNQVTMITDIQLAVFANALGVSLFLLVVLYHYLSVNNPKKSD